MSSHSQPRFLKLRRVDSDNEFYLPITRICRVFYDQNGNPSPEWHTVYFDITGFDTKPECRHFMYFETSDQAQNFYQSLTNDGFVEVREVATKTLFMIHKRDIKAFYYNPGVGLSARSHTVYIDLDGTSDLLKSPEYGCKHVKYFETIGEAEAWCQDQTQ